jgi:hypothetical protein
MSLLALKPYTGVQTVMTTELNSLAATTGKAISAALDNGSYLDIWADFELAVTFGTAPVLNTIVELYALRSLDGGTTYPDGSSSILPAPTAYVGGFPVRAVTTAQVIPLYGVPLGPGLYKLLVQNTTAQVFPASGSTLRMNSYSMQVT